MAKINRRIFFLLGALLFAALFIGGPFVYGIFFMASFLVILSYFLGRNVYRNLVSIVWKNRDKVEAGDKVNLSIEFYNSSLFPIPYFKAKSKLSKRLLGEESKSVVYSVTPGSKVILEKSFVCRYKGVYRLGCVEAEFGDALGLFNWKKSFEANAILWVYPKVYQLKSFMIPVRQHFGTVSVRHNAYEDFASIRDIRKYAVGDHLKKIHWKVSAHRGELFVKNVDLNASADLCIYLDLYAKSYRGDFADELEEKGAECAASIIRYALTRNMTVGLNAKGSEYISLYGNGINRYQEFLDTITKASIEGDTPIWELMRREGLKLGWGATAIVITPDVCRASMEAMLAFKASGIEVVILFLCTDSEAGNESIQLLRQHNFRVYQICLKDDIRQVLGGNYEK